MSDDDFKCSHPGCDKVGIECSLNDDENTTEYFCVEHCYEHGYCCCCGGFWCGTESFDFNNPSHLCQNCQSDNADDDEEDGSYYEPPLYLDE